MSDFHNDYSTGVSEFNSTSISHELQELVDNELEDGETIEWLDQPIPRYFTQETTSQFLFGIPWTTFAVFWTCMAAQGSIVFALWGVPFILIGIGVLSSPIRMRRKMLRIVYVITNRRVITFEGKRGSFDIVSYEADEIEEIHRKQKKNGTGDVFVFQNIRNVKEVEQKLRELKNTVKQNDSDQREKV
ncbi:MAG: hypothetical protein LBG58_12585 [Planctomycetaceae bacterium]|jgi:hypothetical protein|nr:hypothetical protein [Planctomycetaceae bacterium]